MASFLGGLASGLGAIGAGVGRGELLGTQQAERMRSAKAMQDYRTALLAAQQQKAAGSAHNQDIAHAVRLQAGIEKYLNDPEKQADLKNNPGLLTRLLTRHRDLNEVASGRASLTDLPQDSIVDSLASFGIGGGLGMGAGATTAAAPAGPPPTPPPSLSLSGAIAGIGRPGAPSLETPGRIAGIGAPPTPPQRGPGLTLPPNNMGAPPQFALGGTAPPPQPIGPPTPSDIVNRQISSRVFGAQAPEPPSPVQETAATAPPEPQLSPAEQIGADYNKGPGPASGGPPGETLKQFGIRMKGRSSALGLNLKEILADPQVRALNARAGRDIAEGGLATLRTTEEPAKFTSEQKHRAAQTGLAEEQTRVSQLITPLKAANIVNEMQRRNDQTAGAKAKLEQEWASLRERAQNNTLNLAERKRLNDSTISYHDAEKKKIDFAIKYGDKMTPQDKAALALYSRAYFAGHTDNLTGNWVSNYPTAQRSQNRALMNGILAKYQLPPVADPWDTGGEAPAGGGAAAPTAPAAAAAPAAAMSPPTANEKAALKQMMASPGGVHGWLQKANPAQAARVRHVYQTVFPGKSL